MALDRPKPPSSTAFPSLRDRLRGEEASQLHPPPNARPFHVQLRASFASPNAKLSDALTLAGQDIHTSSLQTIQATHDSIAGRVSAFQARASTTQTLTHALYENISRRLDATLCHSAHFPKASVGSHVRALRGQIDKAKRDLDALKGEWEACLREEAAIMAEKSVVDAQEAQRVLGELVAQVDDIVKNKGEKLDDMEQEYRDLLWTESNKLMEAMMAD